MFKGDDDDDVGENSQKNAMCHWLIATTHTHSHTHCIDFYVLCKSSQSN